MCGKRYVYGLRSTLILSLLALVLPLASLLASPLDEITQILTSYESLTISLSTKYDSLESIYKSQQESINQIKSDYQVLNSNYESQSNLLNKQEARLSLVEQTSQDLKKPISDLETGYVSMERKYKIYSKATEILAITLVVYILKDIIQYFVK